MPQVDVKELAFGLFLIALALVAFGATGSLSVGTAADMGPGFVPRALAWIILGFGAVFLIASFFKAPEGVPVPAWRPLVMILASIALFAVLFSTLGLIAACIGTVLVAGAATAPVRWRQLVLCGAVVAAFSALLFVKGLGLPFRLWPPFWPCGVSDGCFRWAMILGSRLSCPLLAGGKICDASSSSVVISNT